MQEHEPDLGALLRHRGSPSLSIYMPLEAGPGGSHDNAIRLKNALRWARVQLSAAGHEPDASLAEAQLSAALRAPTGHGLAALTAPGRAHVHVLPCRVPERIIVGDRFHLRPLIEATERARPYHLLLLQHGTVRLYEGCVDRLTRKTLPTGAPLSLRDSLPELPDEPRIQAHSTGPGGQRAALHGQGLGERRREQDERRFVREVERAVFGALDPSARLVLTGEEGLLRLFRELSANADRIELELPGCFEHEGIDALGVRVDRAITRQRERRVRAAARNLLALTPARDRIQLRVPDVVPSADEGRVDTLFVVRGERRWGHYDANAHAVRTDHGSAPPSQDLLDLAAVRTLEHGGRVMTVNPGTLPADASVAAVLRY